MSEADLAIQGTAAALHEAAELSEKNQLKGLE
jgi:hypothetical protein